MIHTKRKGVAPRVGAWIETEATLLASEDEPKSHPVWVRGLKLPVHKLIWLDMVSLPVWVRGLKQGWTKANREVIQYESHPVWVRGLKHAVPLT